MGITYTISPTMVNEFTFGKSYDSWDYYAQDESTLARSNMGSPPSFDNFATDPNFVNDVAATGRPAHPGQPELRGLCSRAHLRRRPGTQ